MKKALVYIQGALLALFGGLTELEPLVFAGLVWMGLALHAWAREETP